MSSCTGPTFEEYRYQGSYATWAEGFLCVLSLLMQHFKVSCLPDNFTGLFSATFIP